MFDKLPILVLENIILFLNYREIIELKYKIKSIYNYFQDRKNSEYFWKQKCFIEYYPFFKLNGKVNKTWFDSYLRALSSLCINCSELSYIEHPYYNKIVCEFCMRKVNKYKLLNSKECMDCYCLNRNDVKEMTFYKMFFDVQSRRFQKVFLESKVNDFAVDKYNGEDNLLRVQKEKRMKILRKEYMKLVRISELRRGLEGFYIDENFNGILSQYRNPIDWYCDYKFIKYIKFKKYKKCKDFLIEKLKQVSAIVRFLDVSIWIDWRGNFRDTLIFFNETYPQILTQEEKNLFQLL